MKDSDDKGADAADFAAGDDPLAGAGVAGPQDVAAKPKTKRNKIGLPWDLNSLYPIQVPEREDEDDEEEEEQNYATLQRLASADERTKNMTREEYVYWSDCRQASFTFRKAKRFREWAGFGIVTDFKPNDDIVDILGFLTFEIVQTLTEEALKVKEQEDRCKKGRSNSDEAETSKKRKREGALFDSPDEGQSAVELRHVHEAFRKLQATPNKAVAMLLNGARAPVRTPLRLVSFLHYFSTSGLLQTMLMLLTDLNLLIRLWNVFCYNIWSYRYRGSFAVQWFSRLVLLLGWSRGVISLDTQAFRWTQASEDYRF